MTPPPAVIKYDISVAKILIYALPGQTLEEKVAYIFVQLNAWKISWNIAIIEKEEEKNSIAQGCLGPEMGHWTQIHLAALSCPRMRF